MEILTLERVCFCETPLQPEAVSVMIPLPIGDDRIKVLRAEKIDLPIGSSTIANLSQFQEPKHVQSDRAIDSPS
jgi:hypothetical protein